MKTATVQTRDHGTVAVSRQKNRMVPVVGATTLAEYRNDSALLPPWILPRDLAFGLDWDDIMGQLAE